MENRTDCHVMDEQLYSPGMAGSDHDNASVLAFSGVGTQHATGGSLLYRWVQA
jgi:hypothetical protein